MADIVFRYDEMRKAATNIRTIAGQYKTAATTFGSDFAAAVTGWEGESKDAVNTFVSGPVKTYIEETIPGLLEGLAALLEANANQMESADHQIAESIPKSLG